MDILDILLDILLKPPQPFIGLFLLNFETVLTDGKMNNIIILQHQKPCAFLQSI